MRNGFAETDDLAAIGPPTPFRFATVRLRGRKWTRREK